MIYHFVKIIAYIAFKIAFNIRFEGRNNIPKGEPVIYASNHRTNADPPLLLAEEKESLHSWQKKNCLEINYLHGLSAVSVHFPLQEERR